jgi:glycosyltransferase involved in cell wall biosynthesis
VEAQANDSALRIVQLARRFGEATALRVGFEQARGRHILTLPAYRQVRPDAIGAVIDGLAEADLVLGVRSRAGDSAWNRLQARGFRGLVRLLTGADFRDLGSGVRAMKRRVLEEVVLYGDRHRFLPIIADRQGFRIHQIDLPQAAEDRFRRGFRPDLYIRRALDVLSVFFLVRFTKKPLRFFGLVGAGLFVVGSLIVCWLVAERLFFGENLADRPALLLSSLMVVLGVQILAIGLIGELIIFTHAPHLKEYQIECIVENGERREPSVVSLLSEEAGAVRRSVGERR